MQFLTNTIRSRRVIEKESPEVCLDKTLTKDPFNRMCPQCVEKIKILDHNFTPATNCSPTLENCIIESREFSQSVVRTNRIWFGLINKSLPVNEVLIAKLMMHFKAVLVKARSIPHYMLHVAIRTSVP
jgi:hypothetical protein